MSKIVEACLSQGFLQAIGFALAILEPSLVIYLYICINIFRQIHVYTCVEIHSTKFPPEWFESLVFSLHIRICPSEGGCNRIAKQHMLRNKPWIADHSQPFGPAKKVFVQVV